MIFASQALFISISKIPASKESQCFYSKVQCNPWQNVILILSQNWNKVYLGFTQSHCVKALGFMPIFLGLIIWPAQTGKSALQIGYIRLFGVTCICSASRRQHIVNWEILSHVGDSSLSSHVTRISNLIGLTKFTGAIHSSTIRFHSIFTPYSIILVSMFIIILVHWQPVIPHVKCLQTWWAVHKIELCMGNWMRLWWLVKMGGGFGYFEDEIIVLVRN